MDLVQVKKYLRADDEDDDFIAELIEISEIYIDECCGSGYKTNEKGIKLATLVQKKLISDMYENRTPYITDKLKRDTIVQTIFEKLSLMTEEETV